MKAKRSRGSAKKAKRNTERAYNISERDVTITIVEQNMLGEDVVSKEAQFPEGNAESIAELFGYTAGTNKVTSLLID